MSVKTRFQLKNDTEANWMRAINFIPLQGEPIIYLTDETHPFFRIKIGDGETVVSDLPFIDADTIHGIDINHIVPARLGHKLTFGAGQAFVFDGSEDITVPVYTGAII